MQGPEVPGEPIDFWTTGGIVRIVSSGALRTLMGRATGCVTVMDDVEVAQSGELPRCVLIPH